MDIKIKNGHDKRVTQVYKADLAFLSEQICERVSQMVNYAVSILLPLSVNQFCAKVDYVEYELQDMRISGPIGLLKICMIGPVKSSMFDLEKANNNDMHSASNGTIYKLKDGTGVKLYACRAAITIQVDQGLFTLCNNSDWKYDYLASGLSTRIIDPWIQKNAVALNEPLAISEGVTNLDDVHYVMIDNIWERAYQVADVVPVIDPEDDKNEVVKFEA